MKLLNILGAVVAVHIAVLVLVVAIPGCRSNRTATPVVDPQGTPPASAPARSNAPLFTSAPELSDRDLNPPLASNEPPAFDPNAPAVAAGVSSRYSPTRPGTDIGPAPQPYVAPAEVAPTSTYTVQRGDNLWSLAKKNNITVRELAAANNLPADSGLRLGQELVIPGKVSAVAAASPSVVSTESNTATYVIQSGDTLAKIARKHGTTVAQLKAFNGLRSDMVRAGDELAIPESSTTGGASVTDAAAGGDAAKPAAGSASGSDHKHIVASGESLTVIARRYGVKIGDLALANKIRDPSMIRPGQELVIPGVAAQSQAAAPVAAPAVSSRPSTTAARPVTVASDDLDAGLDTTLDNVPVISVETVNSPEGDDADVQTITIGGGSGGDDDKQPPLFR